MKTLNLENEWLDLVSKYTNDEKLGLSIWNTIETHYTSRNRYYHNLNHIEALLIQTYMHSKKISDINSLQFSIWFHDIIYKPSRKDNEKRSADYAHMCLKKLNVTEEKINLIKILIQSTSNHQIMVSENLDNSYLLDFDLSILGCDWVKYEAYTKKIRKEYKIYPDFIYKPGRKKVIKRFLERDSIYFSDYYYNQFEEIARDNLKREMDLL